MIALEVHAGLLFNIIEQLNVHPTIARRNSFAQGTALFMDCEIGRAHV